MSVQVLQRQEYSGLKSALIITRRELRDSLRDWRILIPIMILTIIFPFLMDFTSRVATNWITQYTDVILIERVNPFLLMIVGFFPISFSLIIALESFVGEKERNSIEPILAMPVSDLELYMGKMLSSLILPLFASYLGLTVFLLMRILTTPSWIPPLQLVILVFILTTVEALVMVSGAVVISSQTTSVRAANLLASFIIIPMALLMQAESVVMFYADYSSLWWFVIGLLVVNLILIRMGIRLFNREEILSKELDELNLKTIWRDFKGYFLRPPQLAYDQDNKQAAVFNLIRIYKNDIPQLLKGQKLPFMVIMIVFAAAVLLGTIMAQQYPIQTDVFRLEDISMDRLNNLQRTQLTFRISTFSIFLNNVRVLVLAGVISVFTFGSLTLFLTLINISLVSFVVAEITILGYNPFFFITAFILPHGILELPAILIGMAFALRIGAGLVSPPEGLDVGQGVIMTMANFIKVMIFLIIPMLAVAAYIETNITPTIVLYMYGSGA